MTPFKWQIFLSLINTHQSLLLPFSSLQAQAHNLQLDTFLIFLIRWLCFQG